MNDDVAAAHRRSIACLKVCVAVDDIDDAALRNTLIREGLKYWLSEMSQKEIDQIAAMDHDKLVEYVDEHALDDINSRYDHHPDEPADDDGG